MRGRVKEKNILRYIKRTVTFWHLFRVPVSISIVENSGDTSQSLEPNFDVFWLWLLGDTVIEIQISQGFFDLSVNYKKTLASGKFDLSSKNNIILKIFTWNAQIFTFFNTKHQTISIFYALTQSAFLSGRGEENIILRWIKRSVLFCPLFRVLV